MFIEETFSYLGNIVSLGNLMAMLLGVCIGLVIGAIPGLSPPMAIALLIPVSFEFEPATALILLVSCFAAGIYGGSFSAILLRTPGTSASAASAIEGYELTKKGKAVEAIKVSTFASVMGGIISGFVLLFLSRPLAQVSLWFGPAEYFALAVFGLSMLASISGEAPVKNLIGGCMGLLIATIGVDLTTGIERFTFGVPELYEGIHFIPVLIGLFAVTELLTQAQNLGQEKLSIKVSAIKLPSLEDLRRIKGSILRSSGIGRKKPLG